MFTVNHKHAFCCMREGVCHPHHNTVESGGGSGHVILRADHVTHVMERAEGCVQGRRERMLDIHKLRERHVSM